MKEIISIVAWVKSQWVPGMTQAHLKQLGSYYWVAEEDVGADILRYLDVELPLLHEDECAELAQRAGGLFIYAATAVRYMTPQAGLTREE